MIDEQNIFGKKNQKQFQNEKLKVRFTKAGTVLLLNFKAK